MEAILLAAGRGTRLRPLTENRPKALVEVGDRTLLGDSMDQLVSIGVDRFVVVVGYEGQQIRDRFGDEHRGRPIEYAVQDDQAGVADALRAAEPAVQDDRFLVALADNVFRANLGAVVETVDAGADGAVLVESVPRDEAGRYGVCETDAAGRVERIVEKPDEPPSTLVAAGLYAFTDEVFDACRAIDPSDRGEYEISDAITHYARDHDVATVPLAGWRVDVGYPVDRAEAERRLAGEIPTTIERGPAAGSFD